MQHNKWMKKRLPALFLAVVMTLSVFSVGASAIEGTINFILRDSELIGIDFSEVIIDLESINYGPLVITDSEDNVWADAVFDPQQPCLVRLGSYNERGVFSEDPIAISNINIPLKLVAKSGKLYESVNKYEFSMQNVLGNITDETKIQMYEPKVTVAEQDGDIVKKLAFDFSPDEMNDMVILPTSCDINKEINMAVNLYDYIGTAFRAVPVSYSNGVLTVSIYNGDTEGVAMHGLCVTFNKEPYVLPAYVFTFSFPENMFRFDYNITNAQTDYTYYQTEIENLPLQSLIKTSIPKGWMKVIDRSRLNGQSFDTLTIMTVVFFTPFILTRLYNAVKKSLDSYGLDVKELMREARRGGAFRNILRGLFGIY